MRCRRGGSDGTACRESQVANNRDLLRPIRTPHFPLPPGPLSGVPFDEMAVFLRAPQRYAALLEDAIPELAGGRARAEAMLLLAEISDKMGITKSRVRQLEARAQRVFLRHLQETCGSSPVPT